MASGNWASETLARGTVLPRSPTARMPENIWLVDLKCPVYMLDPSAVPIPSHELQPPARRSRQHGSWPPHLSTCSAALAGSALASRPPDSNVSTQMILTRMLLTCTRRTDVLMQTILWSAQIFEMFSRTDWTTFRHIIVSDFAQKQHLTSFKYSFMYLLNVLVSMALKSCAGLGVLQPTALSIQTTSYLVAYHGLLVLAAGFPCNSFTPLGLGLGEDCPKHGDLGGYVVKIAAAKRPVAVLLENVPMFFSNGQPWYNNMVGAFKEAGYVCRYSILSACDFGLPQQRRRGLIVAVREDVPGLPFKFPLPPKRRPVTLRSALLPADSPDLWDWRKFGQDEVHMEWKKEHLPGPAWDDIVEEVPKSWPSYLGLIYLGTIRQFGVGATQRIYHDLGYHPCVTGQAVKQWIFTRGTDDEGPVVRRVHPLEVRRIQGFPDDFELHHAKTITIKQLANAVPPQMVEWVGRAVAEQYREAFDDDVAKTSRRRISSRKSNRASSQDSSQKSKRNSSRKPSHKRGRKSTHKSRSKSSHSHTSRDSHRSSRKRRVSSDLDEAPPPKRQHRQPATSLETQSKLSTATAGFDGNAKALASPESQSRLSIRTAGFDGNVKPLLRRRHSK